METAEIVAGSPDRAVVYELGAWKLVLDVESLRRDAWRLSHGSGPSIGLTRAERVLVACLFEAAAQCVSCADITRAILGACAGPDNRQRRTTANLPVTIGRLRRKGRRAGLEIPIHLDAGPAPAYCWVGSGQEE